MAVTWGTEQALTQKTGVTSTEEFFAAVDASGALLSQVTIDVDNESGSVTNALVVKVYLSPDGGTDWDDRAFMAFTFLPTAITAQQLTFLVPSVHTFRVGVASAGATDNYTVDLSYRLRTE